MQNILKRKNIYYGKKYCYQKLLDHSGSFDMQIGKCYKKHIFFGGVHKKTCFAVRVGVAQNATDMSATLIIGFL